MASQAPRNGTANAPEQLSVLLQRIAGGEAETISIGEISRALKDRGFGALLILLAAPNLVPVPPGTSTVFGIPTIIIAAQLIVGYRRPLLPRWIRNRTFSMSGFRRAIARMSPWIVRFEHVARPRFWLLPQRLAEQLIGALALVMALILILPIPFANLAPAAAIILMSLGLGERDGVWTSMGIALALLSIGLGVGVIASVGFAALRIF